MNYPMGDFTGKVVIVTAAAGAGIGQAIAKSFGQEGAHVIVSDAHAKRPFQVAEEITRKYGVKAIGRQCDVRNKEEVAEMVKAAVQEWGKIDILVNNAGIDRPAPVWEMDDETWNLVIDVNLKGTFNCCRAVLPVMIKQRQGKIVNLSSVVAWMGGKDEGAAYVAAKAGIQGFTRALATQVGKYHINVNAVAPGLIYNPFLGKVRPPEYFEEVKKQTVLGRMGAPEDVAGAVLFLCSEKAGFITGACLCVSGGWYMY